MRVSKKICAIAPRPLTQSAITANHASRLSHEERHCVNAFNARSGCPKWKVEKINPPTAKA